MRVAIFCTTPEDAYSGGRYHAWMMAEALALGGNEVHFVTDHVPIFYRDLAVCRRHSDLQLHLASDFAKGLPTGVFDIVVLVPGTLDARFYLRSRLFALEREARLVLLNFESANWFNALSPRKRSPREWREWKRAARQASLILSSTREGDRYARDFYTRVLVGAQFGYCYPAINTAAADSVERPPREKRIVVMARFQHAEHKGTMGLASVVSRAMRGHTLVLIVGVGHVPAPVLGELIRRCQKHDVALEIWHRLSDDDKFRELKRARLLLLPSYFEGFGYPPIEARYCGLRCVAFDLPVLRETNGDTLVYARHGDWDDFRRKTEAVLTAEDVAHEPDESIAEIASLEAMRSKLNALLAAIEKCPPLAAAHRKRTGRWLQLRLALHELTNKASLRRLAWFSLRVFLRPAIRALRSYRARAGAPASICYFPPLTTPQELIDHYLHATWYFPFAPGRSERVHLFRRAAAGDVSPEPRPTACRGTPPPFGHVHLGTGWMANVRAMFQCEKVLVWKNHRWSLLPRVARLCGISVLTMGAPLSGGAADYSPSATQAPGSSTAP